MDLIDIGPDYMAFCARWKRWGHGLEATTQVAFEVDPLTLGFKNYEEDRKFNIAIDDRLVEAIESIAWDIPKAIREAHFFPSSWNKMSYTAYIRGAACTRCGSPLEFFARVVKKKIS